MKVNGISCELKHFIVATLSENDELWFYGTFDTNTEAVNCCSQLGFGNAIVLRREEIAVD